MFEQIDLFRLSTQPALGRTQRGLLRFAFLLPSRTNGVVVLGSCLLDCSC